MNELLPCPFCGSKAELCIAQNEDTDRKKLVSSRDKFQTGYWIECLGDNCGIKMGWVVMDDEYEGGMFESADSAALAWNTRSNS